jgi:hypothetical protein
LDLLFEACHFLYLFEVVNVDDVSAEIIKEVHFGIFFLSFFLLLLLFLVFLNLKFFQESSLILGLELIVKISNLFSSLFVNENIIKIP